jgi:DNA-binding winged helix-turn-helix (wHTH) protein/tetratricopeptide (TPR) repeat protein
VLTFENEPTTPATPRLPAGYIFGSFRLDPARHLLFRGTREIPLPERAFRILLTLIRACGDIVNKETLAACAWPDSIVSDGNLSQHIYMLRQILGERARDRCFIMSVSGKGYRFVAPVATESPDAPVPAVAAVAAERADCLDDPFRGSPDAFREYCRGSYLLERRTGPCLWAAIEAFESAIRRDENYAPGFTGLARAYCLLAELGYVPGRLVLARAREAIVRALSIDPRFAMAHASLAEVLLFCDWDFDRAGEEISSALRLNPGSAAVHSISSWLAIYRGELEKARTGAAHALMLEPSSSNLHLQFARVLMHTGEFGAAIASFTDIMETEPEVCAARRYRAAAYLLSGEPEKALADLHVLPQERSEDTSYRLPMLSRALSESGDPTRARAVHDRLLEAASTEYVSHWNIALSAAGLGNDAEAIEHLERGSAKREPALLFLNTLHWFKALERTPRFQRLLRVTAPDWAVAEQPAMRRIS